MYDFYNSPPKTVGDIHQYLTSWLQPITDGELLLINNENWINTHVFTRAFNIHSVFFNQCTCEYAFHVCTDDNNDKNINFPNFGRYKNYDKMIKGVSEQYADLWKLDVF